MANRYVCSVLDEMRECLKTLNFSYLKGLIEETQTLVNRMESALLDKKDIKYYADRRSELKKECEELEEKRNKLKKEVDK